MIRALLWDNDGVLVDTESLYWQATREVLKGAGVRVTRSDFVDLSLRQGRSVFDVASTAGVDAGGVERLRVRRNQRYSELLGAGVSIREGIEACLQSVHGRLPMAIVTSSRPDHFEIIHRDTGLLEYFEFTLTGDDCAQHKPHPQPYLMAARRLQLDPEECLVVEDSERGVLSATRAGMACVAFPHDLTRDGDFQDAHCIVDSAVQLAAVLDELIGRGGTR